MPMHVFALDDADDTRLYVSEVSGDVELRTTRQERFWGYLGPVLHWLYFTPLRRNGPLWSELVIWSSLIGCVLCITGIVWGLWRFSPRSSYRLKRTRSTSPYAGYDLRGARALPVLRVRYADANATWLYLDPERGGIVQRSGKVSRLRRWLYQGFHSLDFPSLYFRRPLWDVVVVALSVGRLLLSFTTLVPAWRRLRRHWRAATVWTRSFKASPSPQITDRKSQIASDQYGTSINRSPLRMSSSSARRSAFATGPGLPSPIGRSPHRTIGATFTELPMSSISRDV
jgi:hypothetical protein